MLYREAKVFAYSSTVEHYTEVQPGAQAQHYSHTGITMVKNKNKKGNCDCISHNYDS